MTVQAIILISDGQPPSNPYCLIGSMLAADSTARKMLDYPMNMGSLLRLMPDFQCFLLPVAEPGRLSLGRLPGRLILLPL